MARLNHVRSFRGTTKTPDGNLTCGKCGDKIKPGDGYRWWANRAPGQRGSVRRIRCMKQGCTPTTAERTPGRRGQLMGIQEDLDKALGSATTIEDLGSVRDDAASQLRDFGQEFADGADNMEAGFGHETYQSAELREKAEAIEAIADEIEGLEAEASDDDAEEFDEEQVGKALSQELFGIDDPAQLEDAQREEWQTALDEAKHDATTDEDTVEQAMEEFRGQISDKIWEVDV